MSTITLVPLTKEDAARILALATVHIQKFEDRVYVLPEQRRRDGANVEDMEALMVKILAYTASPGFLASGKR